VAILLRQIQLQAPDVLWVKSYNTLRFPAPAYFLGSQIHMAADLFPGQSVRDSPALESDWAMHMDDDGYYWHLYPYFESAKLPCDHELIDLYGDNEIHGYELDRLRSKLVVARKDLSWRSDSWEVVTGWSDDHLAPESEIRKKVDKQRLAETIDRLISLIDHCRDKGLKLCVFGD
jgi:hypothetical protein